jgi:ABC-type ATPase with predicted acetyltransferase domain
MKTDLTFLPGGLRVERGDWRSYKQLSRFHYRPKHPRNWSQIWRVTYEPPAGNRRAIAVAVVSYPTRFSSSRFRVFGISGMRKQHLRFINRHIRTISRVIVHPQFRALGLSSLLVRCICKHSDTRYTEAMAVMGRAHPFFEKGGMRKFDPVAPDAPVYYLHTRRRSRRKHNVQRSTSNFQRSMIGN